MQLRILVIVCVFNAVSLRIHSEVKNLGFTSELLTRPMSDISSLVETLMQADPAEVQEIIDLLLVLKNDSVTTEEYLTKEKDAASLEASNAQTALNNAIDVRERAEEALTLAQNDEATRNTELTAANLRKDQTQANLDHQKPVLDSDQETIDVVIGLLQGMMYTSAPTSSPTSFAPTSSPTSFTSPTSTPGILP